MDEEIVIRSAKVGDCPKIVTFLKGEATFNPVWGSEVNLMSIIKQDPNLIQIATLDNQIIGFIILTPHGVNQCFFYRFVIKSALRGKGIGSRLLESAEKVVKQRGGKKISLYVEAKKENLREFYTKRGYITDSILYHSYWKKLE